MTILFQSAKRGWLVGITQKEQIRVDVPKNRPWLILQTSTCRDGHPERTVLACYLTDKRDANSNLKSERCGDVLVEAAWSGAVKKDSLVRLGTIQPIRESEIIEYYSILSPAEMFMVDKELRNLLFGEESVLFYNTSTVKSKPESKPESKPKSVPVAVNTVPQPFLGKTNKPIRKLVSQSKPGTKKRKPRP